MLLLRQRSNNLRLRGLSSRQLDNAGLFSPPLTGVSRLEYLCALIKFQGWTILGNNLHV